MSHLLYAKICMVLTVGIAGLNLHQLFSSYAYVKQRVNEFKDFMEEHESTTSMNVLSSIFYLILPSLYLLALIKAEFSTLGLQIVTVKFVMSGLWAWWVQKRILSKMEYNRLIHFVSKSDNIFNVLLSAGVAYLLIFQ